MALWSRLMQWFRRGPQVGDLVRHEGHLYTVAIVDKLVVELRPAHDGAPWKDITCLKADLQRGTPEGWTDLVRQETEALQQVASCLPVSPRRNRIVAFCQTQPADLADRFAPEAFWYLPGRILERLKLRTLK